MPSIKTRSLGQVCDDVHGVIRTGPFGTQLHQYDYRQQGLPVVMPKDIVDGKVDISSIARIGIDDELRLKEHKLKKGDIVYARRGDIGRRALISERETGWLCGTGSLRISLGGDVLDPCFLYYYLGNPDVISWIQQQAVGSTMSNLNTSIVRSIPITFPPLPTQRKIAAILSAYDDLIENNTRRIKILEEIAQAIYREWFVHFRFPGHEGVKLVESELGLVPDGWEVKSIGKLISLHVNGGWGEATQSEQFSRPAYVIRGTDIPKVRSGSIVECPLRFHKPSNLASRILRDEDILMEISGGSNDQPVGRVLFVRQSLLSQFDEDVICASFCKLLRVDQNQIYPGNIYFHLREIYDNRQIMKYQVQSTGITNFKSTHFLENEKICIPKKSIQTIFMNLVEPLINQIYILGHNISCLRTTRDLLLPKLISGVLDVSELDIPISN